MSICLLFIIAMVRERRHYMQLSPYHTSYLHFIAHAFARTCICVPLRQVIQMYSERGRLRQDLASAHVHHDHDDIEALTRKVGACARMHERIYA